jgi:hypothetical protein
MDYGDQIDAFDIELTNLIDRFQREFDLHATTIVGVLEEKKVEIATFGTSVFDAEEWDGDSDDDSSFL